MGSKALQAPMHSTLEECTTKGITKRQKAIWWRHQCFGFDLRWVPLRSRVKDRLLKLPNIQLQQMHYSNLRYGKVPKLVGITQNYNFISLKFFCIKIQWQNTVKYRIWWCCNQIDKVLTFETYLLPDIICGNKIFNEKYCFDDVLQNFCKIWYFMAGLIRFWYGKIIRQLFF